MLLKSRRKQNQWLDRGERLTPVLTPRERQLRLGLLRECTGWPASTGMAPNYRDVCHGGKRGSQEQMEKWGIRGQNTNSVCITSNAHGIACFKINSTIYISGTLREGLILYSCIKMLITMGLTLLSG